MLMLLCASGCKKEKIAEIDKLPAATQTGANTFGCLVNGKAWVAQTDCKFLCDAPFGVYYDNSNGGYLALTAKYQNASQNANEEINIAFDSTNTKTQFSYIKGVHSMGIRFLNFRGNTYNTVIDSTVNGSCILKLTRYDLSMGIISGTFNFTLWKPGFDTVFVTEGRFDKKL